MIFHLLLLAYWPCSVAHCLATKIIVRVQVDLVEKAWFCCYWQAHPWLPKLLWQKVIDTNILGRYWPRTHINLISSWICGPTPHLSPLSKCEHLQFSTPWWRSSSTPGFTLHWVLYSKSPEHFPQTQHKMQLLHQVILHWNTRALLILIRSWVALSFKVVSEWGICNTWKLWLCNYNHDSWDIIIRNLGLRGHRSRIWLWKQSWVLVSRRRKLPSPQLPQRDAWPNSEHYLRANSRLPGL